MKKIYAIILTFFLSISFVYADEFDVSSKNIILYNLNDNTVLYNINEDEKVSIASLTKIMTSIVAIENINDLNEYVVIKDKDFEGLNGYSKAGFKVNDKVTYLDLLYGILLPSGADAVNAIINNTLGYDSFINQMNELAKKIGMNNTSFSNPVGMDDENNYSSAKDVSILLSYALKNDTFKKIFTTKSYTTTNGIKLLRTVDIYKNGLNTDEILGAKTGFTLDAGRCLASTANLNNVDYMLIVLGSNPLNASSAIKDSLTIYDYYKDNYSYQKVLSKETEIKRLPIEKSKEKEYIIYGNDDIEMYLKNNADITYEFDGVEKVKYNTKKGALLGKINIYNGNNLLTSLDVHLDKNIKYNPSIVIIIVIIILLYMFWKIVKKLLKRMRKKRRKMSK